jgi:UDP-N-acetylmuramoyl-tripeptide--D-alanyl-D-alanine ligase
MKLSVLHIADLISGSGEFPGQAISRGYSIDSRTVQPGEVFFAVKGENMDGHDFVEPALRQGAIAAVVRRDQRTRYPAAAPLIAVADPLAALQTLAGAVRRLWGKPLIGVTGSAGKTTTKEAIAHVLATKFRVLKSEGNFNNHFGLPLMLLKIEPGHDVAVIERGMSHAGEIKTLANIAQPEVGVVTNVAAVHLEYFNSISEIARAKYELIQSLPPGGIAILNADDEYVSQFSRDFHGKVITYGFHPSADVRAERVQSQGMFGSSFDLVIGGCREPATLPLVGTHNIANALAAVAVSLERGLTPSEAAAALATITPANQRGQVVKLGNITVINDCYNSNPKALDAMVDALAATPAARRIVVAGEMLELGPSAEEMHRQSGWHIAQRRIDVLLGVRGLAEKMADAARAAGTRAEFVRTPQEAGSWLTRETRPGDVVLLKASRGVKLERALEQWMSQQGPQKPAEEP